MARCRGAANQATKSKASADTTMSSSKQVLGFTAVAVDMTECKSLAKETMTSWLKFIQMAFPLH